MTKLARVSGIVQEGSLYVLLFLLPFSKASIEILFGFLFFGWLTDRLNPTTRADTLWLHPSTRPLLLAMGGFLTVCALSIVVSTHPALSLKAFFCKWLEYLLFFVVVADVARHPWVIRRSSRVFMYAALGVLVEAVTQERYGNGFFRNHRLDFFSRMSGPYENPIDLATYLMVVIPILLAYVTTRRKATRWQLWLLVGTLVACLGRTEAVGAWLGLGAGLVVISLMKTQVRRAGLVLIGIMLLSAGISLYRQGRLVRFFSVSEVGTVDRWHMWQAAIRMIQDRPILGHGLNTFMANYLDYWVGGQRQPRYAHNCYLQMTAETGVVGLVAFVWLLWLLLSRVVDVLRRDRPKDQALLVGYAAGLVAFALQSGIDTNFYALRQAVLFWVVAGLSLGLSSQDSSADLEPAPLRLRRGTIVPSS